MERKIDTILLCSCNINNTLLNIILFLFAIFNFIIYIFLSLRESIFRWVLFALGIFFLIFFIFSFFMDMRKQKKLREEIGWKDANELEE